MCPIGYYTITRQSKDPKLLRYELLRYARRHGVKPARRGGRVFNTTPKTVRNGFLACQGQARTGLIMVARHGGLVHGLPNSPLSRSSRVVPTSLPRLRRKKEWCTTPSQPVRPGLDRQALTSTKPMSKPSTG